MVVKSELEKIDIQYKAIDLVAVEASDNVPPEKLKLLDKNLRKYGLELIEGRKNILAERIKTNIIELVYNSNGQLKINLSDYLSEKLNYNYTYLSNTFSEIQGITIEKFFLKSKIERVKELLVYGDLNLKEISYITQYSSIGHLSNQFKKVTGLPPSKYKNLYIKKRHLPEKVAVPEAFMLAEIS
jgi:AraC-like DNA-binding protein